MLAGPGRRLPEYLQCAGHVCSLVLGASWCQGTEGSMPVVLVEMLHSNKKPGLSVIASRPTLLLGR